MTEEIPQPTIPRPVLPPGADCILVTGKRGFKPRRRWAIIDAEDLPMLKRMGRWHMYRDPSGKVYPECRINDGSGRLRIAKMHVEVAKRMGIWEEKCVIDHKDGDTFNARSENLRAATLSQNRMNVSKVQGYGKSRHRGVSWDPQKKSWRTRLVITAPEVLAKHFPGKTRATVHGGFFQDQDEAALKWNELALRYYDATFVRLNEVEKK